MNARSRSLPGAAVAFAAVLVVSACRPPLLSPTVGSVQVGTASWYGPGFHGKATSSREIYDMYDVTAAHPTLPLGTRVMVTNLANGHSAIVRINDRGPFVGNRIIDLSYSAAYLLDMVGPGTARVRVEVLKAPPDSTASPRFSLQVGAFSSRENARALADALKPEFREVYVAEFPTETRTFYRVRIPARDRSEAARIAARLADLGHTVVIFEGD
jgi:rare lipoprotein A